MPFWGRRILIMKAVLLFVTSLLCFELMSCNINHTTVKSHPPSFEFEGVIQKRGFTTYMYGTHTISSNNKTYALQSTTINLDSYLNNKVLIKGAKVNGYPVEDGPELIDVKSVEKK